MILATLVPVQVTVFALAALGATVVVLATDQQLERRVASVLGETRLGPDAPVKNLKDIIDFINGQVRPRAEAI